MWHRAPNKNGKPKVDNNNPDVKLQSLPVMGLMILSGFNYKKDEKELIDGRI